MMVTRKKNNSDFQFKQLDSWGCHQPSTVTEKNKDKCVREKILSSAAIMYFWSRWVTSRCSNKAQTTKLPWIFTLLGLNKPNLLGENIHICLRSIWNKTFSQSGIAPSSWLTLHLYFLKLSVWHLFFFISTPSGLFRTLFCMVYYKGHSTGHRIFSFIPDRYIC